MIANDGIPENNEIKLLDLENPITPLPDLRNPITPPPDLRIKDER